MLKLLYGTTNDAKIKQMNEMLVGMEIEVIGLSDMNKVIPKVIEDGRTPLENARKKAKEYYKEFKIPVFSCDSGFYLERLNDIDQPGLNIRRVDGRELSDEEMIQYYSNLAKSNGGELIGQYVNAICFIVDEKNIFEYQGPKISTGKFILSEKPFHKRKKGFPIDSLSKDIKTKKYLLETRNNSKDSSIKDGVREFFKVSLKR